MLLHRSGHVTALLIALVGFAQAQPPSAKFAHFDHKFFSFDYPANWKIEDNSGANQPSFAAYSSEHFFNVGVDFQQGFVNVTGSGSGNQCAGVDKDLLDDFENVRKLFAGEPNTRVTYQRLGVGRRGGRSIDIDVVRGGSGGAVSYWMNAIPTKHGLYTLTVVYPSTMSMEERQRLVNKFAESVVMKDDKLPSNAYCSYYMP